MGGDRQINSGARIVLGAALLVGSLFLPPWLVFCLATAGLFYFENLYEILCAGFILDMLYGMPTYFAPIPFVYTTAATVLFLAVAVLKKHLRFYR